MEAGAYKPRHNLVPTGSLCVGTKRVSGTPEFSSPVGLGRSCLCPTSCRSAGALGAAGGLSTTESSPHPAAAPVPTSPWPRSLGARGIPQTGLGASSRGSAGRAGRQQEGPSCRPCSAPGSLESLAAFPPQSLFPAGPQEGMGVATPGCRHTCLPLWPYLHALQQLAF